MTVIAWDGKTLAADKRTTLSGVPITTSKLGRAGGLMYGCAGSSAPCREIGEWIESGMDPAKIPSFQRDERDSVNALIIDNGVVCLLQNGPVLIRTEMKQMAIGSGGDFAVAAMHLGKTAREAVEIACLFDVNCGNGVDTMCVVDRAAEPLV